MRAGRAPRSGINRSSGSRGRGRAETCDGLLQVEPFGLCGRRLRYAPGGEERLVTAVDQGAARVATGEVVHPCG